MSFASSSVSPADALFDGSGEMRARCRAVDWGAGPLGPVDGWPVSLRTTVALLLAARYPMILFWGPERVQLYNDAYIPTLGGPDRHPVALGMRAKHCWQGKVWDIVGSQIDLVVATGQATLHEDQYVPLPRDGVLQDTYWSYSYGPAFDDAGRVAGVLVITEETTARVVSDRERLTAETALAAERTQLRAIVDLAPAFIAVLRGTEHRFERLNGEYDRLVAGRVKVGQSVAEALPEIVEQGFIGLLDAVLTTGEPFIGRAVPVRLIRKAGAGPETRYVDFVYQALTEADGVRSGVFVHGIDVTDAVEGRHRAEQLLSQSERSLADAEAARHDAEEANRAKTAFLAMMSHELRTPLNAIGGYAELMELGIRGPVTDAQRTDLRRIQASQGHLLGLVNEVLDLARVDSGELVLALAPVRTGDTIDAALALVRPQAAEKLLQIAAACDDANDSAYLGDEPRVRQVLVNLLANAVKFTAPGGVIAVGCTSANRPADAELLGEGPFVVIEIRDTGVGITADQLARIFEPFTQADGGLTRERGGTGLGLAISRRLARLMGGDITVESKPGEGSTFRLWLSTPDMRVQGGRTAEVAEEYHALPLTSGEGAATRLPLPLTASPETAPGIARIGKLLVSEVSTLMHEWLVRLRADALIPTADRSDTELEDHGAAFVTDVALALRTIGASGGDASALLRDGTAILGLIAERHGAQRARLGWREEAIRQEFALLGELLADTIGRLAMTANCSEDVAGAATRTIAHLLEQGKRLSLSGYRLVTATG